MSAGYLAPGHSPLQFHPLANLFPMLADDRRPSFRASLAEGQNNPIWLHQGMILDGRNRYRELTELGKGVDYRVFRGNNLDAFRFVMAENLERRHLTESQRAMVAAKAATLGLGANQHTLAAPIGAPSFEFTPQPRQPEPAADADDGVKEALKQSWAVDDEFMRQEDERRAAISQQQAADMLNVSRRAVQRAAVVLDKGAPELQDAVVAGDVKVSAAADIAALPIEEQRAIIAAADPKIVKEVSKANRVAKATAGRQRRLDNMAKPDATPLLSGGNKASVLYIDIPRKFVQWNDDTGAEKSPENHYRVETFEYLAGLREQILAMTKPDSVVFMWAWANSLLDQIDLLAEWGFASLRRRDDTGRLLRGPDGRIMPPVGEGRYRSHQIWAKRAATGNYNRGTGFWFIDCHELLLVGARGDVPAPLMGTQAMSILDGQVGDHSAKPEAFRDQIDHYFPGVPKLELFGRVDDRAAWKARWPDWEVWGNEAQPALSAEAAE